MFQVCDVKKVASTARFVFFFFIFVFNIFHVLIFFVFYQFQRIKVELTIGKAKSIAEEGQLPGVGVTFWDCAKSAEFGVGLPIIDDALAEVRNYLDQLQNKVLCTNAMIEMRPENTGRITICSCCSDLCNKDNELCTTSTYTSLSNLFIDPFVTAAQSYLTNASLMTGIQLGFDSPTLISQANIPNSQSPNFLLLLLLLLLSFPSLFSPTCFNHRQ